MKDEDDYINSEYEESEDQIKNHIQSIDVSFAIHGYELNDNYIIPDQNITDTQSVSVISNFIRTNTNTNKTKFSSALNTSTYNDASSVYSNFLHSTSHNSQADKRIDAMKITQTGRDRKISASTIQTIKSNDDQLRQELRKLSVMVKYKEHEIQEILKLYENLKLTYNEKQKKLKNNKEKIENLKTAKINLKKLICEMIKQNS